MNRNLRSQARINNVEERCFKKQPATQSEEYDFINQILLYGEAQLDERCAKLSIAKFPIRINGKLLTVAQKIFVWRTIRANMDGKMFRSLKEVIKAANPDKPPETEQKQIQKKPECVLKDGFCVRPYNLCHTFTKCEFHMAQAEGRKERTYTYFH